MDHFAGLDVSVKDTSVCIMDDTGKIVREVKVPSEPKALLKVLTNPSYRPPVPQAAKGEASTVKNSPDPSINPSRSQAASFSLSPSPFYVLEPHQSSVA
jgi:hypothetical protein